MILWKKSRLFTCQCNFIHMTQGPMSCWVCGDEITAYTWQMGKPEENRLKKPQGFGKELTLDGSPRWWCPDTRDPMKDLYRITFRGRHQIILPQTPGYDQCFAGDDRWDLETKERFDHIADPPLEVLGLKSINHLFGL